jgi:hypothetical protein
MARPRWQLATVRAEGRWLRRWDRFVAVWASLNLLLVAFDLTYLPLRRFWLQRNLYPIPSLPLAVPLDWIPDLTPWLDPIKGIEPHQETQAYLDQFDRLDRQLRQQALPDSDPPAPLAPALAAQARSTAELIASNGFAASGNTASLETVKQRLRQRAGTASAQEAAARLLSPAWISRQGWQQERRFWQEQVLPLVAANYWRSSDANGRPTDHFWLLDLLCFQSVFLVDILLRVVRLKRRLPGLRWRDALLRRWIDLPLLLPFWRWLRLLPVLERLHTSGLVSIEPLRAVISRAVVALLALELFEVLALQLLDGAQGLVRSRDWPERFRRLRSHQSVPLLEQEEQELVALVRLWGPLLLARIAPSLAPDLQNLLSYALSRSLDRSVVPQPLRGLQPLLRVENGVSRQLAAGMVDSLMELSRSTGTQLARRDDVQLELLQRLVDRFWEELAAALEQGPVLQRSQELVCALLEQLKTTYLSQISRSGIEALIEELDELVTAQPATGPSGGQSGGQSGSQSAAREAAGPAIPPA